MTGKRTLLEDSPDWRWWAKLVAIVAVAAATALKNAALSPTVSAVCDVVIGLGATLGIGSAGLSRSR